LYGITDITIISLGLKKFPCFATRVVIYCHSGYHKTENNKTKSLQHTMIVAEHLRNSMKPLSRLCQRNKVSQALHLSNTGRSYRSYRRRFLVSV